MIHVGIRSAWVALMVAVALTPAAASADEIQVTMEASRVSLTATNAPLTDVLAEWARVGATEFIDADKLAAAPVTLELIDVAESDALRILLCPVTGYLAARRAAGAPGASVYDRVKILATRRAPRSRPAPRSQPPFGTGIPAPRFGAPTSGRDAGQTGADPSLAITPEEAA